MQWTTYLSWQMSRRRPQRAGSVHGGGADIAIGTLDRVRERFLREREDARRRVERAYRNDPSVLGGEANPYLDPFTNEWRAWYTDSADLRAVHVSVY